MHSRDGAGRPRFPQVATIRLALTFSLVVVGLTSRSALDKVLAVQGGGELVAVWAQVSSLIDLVVGVVAGGVGAGLVVQVARAKREEGRREQFDAALRLGLRIAFPVALVAAAASWPLGDFLSGGRVPPWTFALAAGAGWLAVVPTLIGNYWLGQRRYAAMLLLAIAQTAGTLGAALVLPEGWVLAGIALMQAVPAAMLLFMGRSGAGPGRPARRALALRRYVLPGLSIGILGPLSFVVARSTIGESLSWHDAGVLQALFRLADWVCGIASGFLSLLYLPRFAAARGPADLAGEMRAAALAILLPSAIAFAFLYAVHGPLLAALYDPGVQAPDAAVALYFAGSWVRIVAWIPLYALFALRRTLQIAVGELLSLPLFAALLYSLGARLTLESASAMWLAAYCAYATYNLHAAFRSRDKARTSA